MRRGNSGLVIARQMPMGGAGVFSPFDLVEASVNAYKIKNSVRMRSGSSFTRTAASNGTSSQKFTLSWWGRLGTTSGATVFIGGYYGSQYAGFKEWGFNNAQQFNIGSGTYAISTDYNYQTPAVFNDTTRFHHFHIAVDTTQAVASRRFMFFYDNVLIGFNGYPGQNEGMYVNTTQPNRFFGGEMEVADAYMIDGQQLMPSAFQTADGRNLPVQYTGTYGLNGWHLEFADTSAVTNGSNVGIGKDTSGNGYYLNSSGISVTAGATFDGFTDVPTNTSSRAAQFAVLDRTNPSQSTLTNNNLTASGTTDLPTLRPTKGNWYFEIDGVAKTWTPPAAFPAAAGNYNFGQRPLSNAIPAGYALLNSFNVQLLGS